MLLKEFLDKFPPPAGVIFAKIWGSRSHNTAKESSDTDFAGVYLCPTKDILSLKPPEQTFKHDTADDAAPRSKEESPDYAFYEVHHFSNLLLVGNPGILEYLYTEKLYMTTPEWDRLRNIRDRFLSQSAVLQYVGYMQGQMKRLIHGQSLHTATGKYNEKWAYHILRLTDDLQRICKGERPIVWKEGAEQEFLMRVRRNEYTWLEVKSLIEQRIAAAFKGFPEPMPAWDDKVLHNAWLKSAVKSLPLPEKGDAGAVEDWLLTLRKENWSKPEPHVCKHLDQVPPVVSAGQMQVMCPNCKHYYPGTA